MKRVLSVAVLVVSTILLAGCHEPEPGAGGDNIVADPDSGVTAITVIRSPASASPGESAIVCWELQGQGKVPHTAVHWDNETHPQGGDFTIYDAGVSYPANETDQDPDGYEVPRSYCTAIPVGNETIYWRAHVIVEVPPGTLSDEQTIVVTDE